MENKKKVLIVSDYYYPHWTGISKSLYNLTQTLKSDFYFTVLTVQFNKHLKKEEIIGNTRVIRCGYLFKLSRAKYSFSLIFTFIELLKSNDIVIINSPFTNILPVALLTKIFGKKLIIFHQGDLILPAGIVNKAVEKIFDASTFIALALSSKIATYTTDYASNSPVMKPFLKKTFSVQLPILIAKIKKNPVTEQLADLRKQEKLLYGFAGRFVEEKGFDILYEAIPLVVKKIPNSHFVFAGETKMGYEHFFEKNANKLQNIRKHITFLGLLNENDLSYFYKTIDFIVVPSRSDCFPLVQAEAMLWGKPAIVSDIPGARFLVQKTGFGLLFKKNDPIDLADKISRIAPLKKRLMQNYKLVKKILDPYLNAQKFAIFVED